MKKNNDRNSEVSFFNKASFIKLVWKWEFKIGQRPDKAD